VTGSGRSSARACAAGLILAGADCAGFAALAQPDASFRARCETLQDSLNRLGVGDTAMVFDTSSENRPDYIKLDPCLHARAPAETP
jgi:hypothetical protein